MKKNYIAPSILVVNVESCMILSGSSIDGIDGTAKISTILQSDESTSEYFSRRGSCWDEEYDW